MKESKVEVKQISDREIWVNKTKIYLGDDNIIYDISIGAPDEKIAIEEIKAILKLANIVEGKVNLFVDLNKTDTPSSKARAKYRELAEHNKVNKVAFFGLHPVAKIIASFFIGTLIKKDIRFMKSKEEALA